MFARFFVDRPIFATVLSVVIVIVGMVALTRLPVAQYPEVTPPTIQVTASYPGANARTVADTVATPIEQQVNGVEGMIYMSSQCTNDGQMVLNVTFELGTDLDMAQVLVQNRVAIAEPKLPEEVKRIGVTTKKKSPSILLAINLISPDGSYSQVYLSNFATLNIKDDLARIPGVGDVAFLGPRDYSMRIWLDPDKLASRGMTPTDVINAVKTQNIQVAAGRLGQPPVPASAPIRFQLPINTQGRLTSEEEFARIVVRTSDKGGVVHLEDLVRDTRYDGEGRVVQKGVELGAQTYDVNSYLDSQPAITLAVFQLPGSNALDTAEHVRAKMEELRARFPAGVEYRIVYDTTVFIDESVHEVYKTLLEAFVLVFIVVLLFLQDWRATLLPMIDVAVSLMGTFAVMLLLGFSLNNLTLFGLVLAIGIVVDDAIIVVENVERWMSMGHAPREATIRAMDEITGPIIAITLVLASVFIPTAFIVGISGQFYRQFALTIAASTVISAVNAMTMGPARAVVLIKPHAADHEHDTREALPPLAIALVAGLVAYLFLSPLAAGLVGIDLPGAAGEEDGPAHVGWSAYALWAGVFLAGAVVGFLVSPLINRVLGILFRAFNWAFDRVTRGYGRIVKGAVRISFVMIVVYGGLIALAVAGFQIVPGGFIPQQDKGYLIVSAQLPDGATLERTDDLVQELAREVRQVPGVAHTLELSGYSMLLSTNISNAGGMFVILEPFEHRKDDPARGGNAIALEIRKKLAARRDSVIVVFGAPPVDGLGNTGGFKMQVQDRAGAGLRALQGSVQSLADQGSQQPGLYGLFSTFTVTQPQLYVDIDREKALTQKVPLDTIYTALQSYLGTYYVNDFSFQNRNWQVNLQAESKYRLRPEDVGRLEVRNAEGRPVPLRTLVTVRYDSGPAVVNHYNLYPSAEINGNTIPGTSSGEAIAMMDELAEEYLPSTMGFAWTDLSYQEVEAGKDVLNKLIFPLSVLFVFLVLAALYESWSLPFSIILIVPMCLLAAIAGVFIARMDNNIFTQIGLVVLVAMAAKNAILVVEFAKQKEDEGMSRLDATLAASTVRLRPILMTSFAFIFGVLPLVLARGAGAEMRIALGVAVFSGMIGVTFFGLIFTPVFYYVIRGLAARPAPAPAGTAPRAEPTPRKESSTAITTTPSDGEKQDEGAFRIEDREPRPEEPTPPSS